MKMFFRCPEGGALEEVQKLLSAIDGVSSVAKLPGAGCDDGLLDVESEEALEAAIETIQSHGGEIIKPGDTLGLGGSAAVGGGAGRPKRGAKKDAQEKEVLKKFFGEGATYQERKRQQQQQRDHQEEDGGEDADGKPSERRQNGNRRQQGGGRGRGRGGRGRGGYGRGRGGRGRGRGGYVMPQFVEGHVASINGIPPSMTNDQIAEAFSDCGTIFDIARYENLAMVYFDSTNSVLEAICKVNGHSLNGSVVTVSDGGILRVPIPM